MRANLACRHLTQAQKRDLIRSELERDPSRSDREIGRLCGADHKTVGSVRGGEFPHPDTADAYLAERARVIHLIGELGFEADEDAIHETAVRVLLEEAARGLLRYGVLDPPPPSWKPVAGTSARTRVVAEANRLLEWNVRVQREAGEFLSWCDQAGIKISGKRVTFAERLAYPMTTEVRELLAEQEWTPLDHHQAARGHFYMWWYTRSELRELAGETCPARS